MSLDVKFVVVGGETKTAEVKLRLPTIIGRGRSSGIMVPHPLVSRQHCEIYEQDGRLMVRDLGSLNGTFVGQEKITDAALLPEHLLTVGNVTFRAVYEISAEAASAPLPVVKPKETPPGGIAINTAAANPVATAALGNKTVPAPAPVKVAPPAPNPAGSSKINIDAPESGPEDEDSSLDFAAFLKSLEDGK